MPRTKSHKHAQASCTILTGLTREELLLLCDEAAVQAASVQFSIHRGESRPEIAEYIVRTPIGGIGKLGEKMTIRVDLADASGQTRIRTSIARYTMKRAWPLPWEMLAWRNYKNFMATLAMLVTSRDPNCTANIIETASPSTPGRI